MMTRCAVTLLTLAAVTASLSARPARAEWKVRAIWCVSDLVASDGGDVVTSLQSHQNAHERYCEACRGGADQYDSVLACYKADNEKSTSARAEIESAGRAAVNQFLAARSHACCKAPPAPPPAEPEP